MREALRNLQRRPLTPTLSPNDEAVGGEGDYQRGAVGGITTEALLGGYQRGAVWGITNEALLEERSNHGRAPKDTVPGPR